ncbi:RagB/SusD family nutrient uptake outer membrane protein [Robertkochia solimangrovi]|uniref:RagB/SusD family nutrient uptake outer membrane protein n=1 Tax=Robertkochia solimangrovi TaxID=2213046 RepID=UPI0011808761|nr:RagB/SusD family nutrient uptake outer membrane protein [Robertkochia solimangrovi]TRZ45739.1 hypothetical protein DMZ48_00205 [Robertkochia solimangrovi]
MKSILKYILLSILIGACETPDEFLDVKPDNSFNPSTLGEFESLLNNVSFSYRRLQNLTLIDPDIAMNDQSYANIMADEVMVNAFRWNHELYNEITNDPDYNDAYSNIFTFNQIIMDIEEATVNEGYEESDRANIKAEAHAQRAMEYFLLINEYAAHYDPDHPDIPGIPMPLENDIEAQLPRSSVSDIYSQILSDLEMAATLFDDTFEDVQPEANFRPGLASIYGLLAEVHLYMGEFEQAASYAEDVLLRYNFLYDYNTIELEDMENPWKGITETDLTFATLNKEVIWNRYHRWNYYNPFYLFSDDLVSTFDKARDRRWYFWSTQVSQNGIDTSPYYIFCMSDIETNAGITIPRLLLTYAEAQTRSGNVPQGLEALNTLLTHRISNFRPYEITDQNELLQLIKTERRKELFGTSLNTFDQKRYHIYGEKVPVFERSLNGMNYELSPGDQGYFIAIPLKIRNINPNL